ncbi:cuticle protein 10.9-like [Tachypleus tridentatus]|uniref:cuticle protein 10.9-like n=1 Tax=Tachypleus tridentatus TaxID=6853 RepID=UPI003FD19858
MLKAVVFMTFIAGCFAGYLVAPQAVSAAYDINVPTPYETGYDTVDEFGTRLVRQETGDGAGRVQGSYGYADAQGIWRDVKYVADEGGFRASVSTNEPELPTRTPLTSKSQLRSLQLESSQSSFLLLLKPSFLP